MEVQFLDTNILIRYLTQDHPDHAEQARRLLQLIQAGTITVTTSESVITEVVWVLSSPSLYRLPRPEIRRHLTNILALKHLRLRSKRTYARALELYATTNLDFVDALSVAHMERSGVQTIWSFDEDFDRIAGIRRREIPRG